MSNVVRITGIGINQTVEVKSDESLAEVTKRLGLDPSLSFRANGESLSLDSTFEEDAVVTATPANVKLGA